MVHPDFDLPDRVIPLDKKLSLNIQIESSLIAMQEIQVLELDQTFYRQNLDKFGPELQKLKHLSIDHKAGTDQEIFKAISKLPETLVLDNFKVF